MSRRVLVRAPAEQEIARAVARYREISPQLAGRFRDSIRERMRRLAERAEMYPCISGEIRRTITRDFPYSLFFLIDGPEQVVVLRLIHHARDPAEWPT